MSDPKDNELSLDELKDASGGLKGDDRGTYGLKGDRVSPNQLKGDRVMINQLKSDGMGHGKITEGLGCNAGGFEFQDKKIRK